MPGKRKKEYIVLSLVIAALLVYLVMRNPDQLQYDVPGMESLDAGVIDRLVIESADRSIELASQDGKWIIQPEGFPADGEKVEKMVEVLANLELSDVISESENYVRYGLDADNRIVFTGYGDGDMLRTLFIGKQAATYRHTYVSLPDDSRVFHAMDAFRSQFETDVDGLRDKTVLQVDPETITGISLESPEFSLVAVKEMTAAPIEPAEPEGESPEAEAGTAAPAPLWKSSTGKTLDAEKMDTLLSRLTVLKCRSFIEEAKKAQFTSPIYTLRVTGTEPITLEIFPKQDEDGGFYPAVSSQSDYPFTLSTYAAEELMKKPDELVKQEAEQQ